MEAIALFKQNFAVAQSLLQLHDLFYGMRRIEPSETLRLAVCTEWKAAANSVVQHACNGQVSVLAKSTTRIPESLTMSGGMDFLLRQAVVVACTSLESYFWDVLRENVLTVVQARKSKADESIRGITITIEDYISIQKYGDPDVRLKQLILMKFERGTLYDTDSIEKIARILTITDFWQQIDRLTGKRAKDLKALTGELITRRNQIAHRADRPKEDEDADGHGLRPINFAWTNERVQAANTLVSAAADVIGAGILKLETALEAAKEQELARQTLKEGGTAPPTQEARADAAVESDQIAEPLPAPVDSGSPLPVAGVPVNEGAKKGEAPKQIDPVSSN